MLKKKYGFDTDKFYQGKCFSCIYCTMDGGNAYKCNCRRNQNVVGVDERILDGIYRIMEQGKSAEAITETMEEGMNKIFHTFKTELESSDLKIPKKKVTEIVQILEMVYENNRIDMQIDLDQNLNTIYSDNLEEMTIEDACPSVDPENTCMHYCGK